MKLKNKNISQSKKVRLREKLRKMIEKYINLVSILKPYNLDVYYVRRKDR